MAALLGPTTVLIDVTAGPPAPPRGSSRPARELGCDLVFLADIGGDVIAAGDEPGLASPLCDAVMIAARAGDRRAALLGVLGAGCDGELTPGRGPGADSGARAGGAWLGALGSARPRPTRSRRAAVAVTEASLMVARCARGEIGETEIRGGSRTVELGPVAALCFLFDPAAALAERRWPRRSRERRIDAASEALDALGIRTELDYERDRAAAPSRRRYTRRVCVREGREADVTGHGERVMEDR